MEEIEVDTNGRVVVLLLLLRCGCAVHPWWQNP